MQVLPKIGFDFAAAMRSFLRADPDVIMVGEMRDHETVSTGIEASLTGHLVFSTLHTNDSCGAITRLLDMGVENFLLSSTLLGVLAQRLVRVICPFCKERTLPEERLIKSMGIDEQEAARITFYHGKGCEECRQTGFRGRIAIFEFLQIDEEIRKEIINRSSTEIIKKIALKNGLFTLRQDGWEKVKLGRTTISEVLRVTLEE